MSILNIVFSVYCDVQNLMYCKERFILRIVTCITQSCFIWSWLHNEITLAE